MEEILFFFIQVVEYGSIILQEALVNDIEPIRLDIELVDHLESARLWVAYYVVKCALGKI